jgi:hypothetical protein
VLVLSSHAELSYAERLLGMEVNSRSLGYLLKERVGELMQSLPARWSSTRTSSIGW